MKKKILIIDDTEDTHIILKEILVDGGYQIEYAENGQVAIDYIKKNSIPDLILLDLMMPEVDGLSFLKIIRREGLKDVNIGIMPAQNLEDNVVDKDPLEAFNSRLKNIPVIIMSAKDSKEDVIAVKNLGISGYIRKPFNAETICNAIEQQFEGH